MAPGTVWDADMDRKLLMAIIATHQGVISPTAIAQKLTADGHELTTNAVRKRLKRIESMVAGDAGTTSSPDKTKAKKRSGGADEDADEVESKPVKPIPLNKKRKGTVKLEVADEDGRDEQEGFD